MKDRFKLIPAVYLVVMEEGKVLLLRRFNTGYEDGKYSLPAGHLDGDEPLTTAMVREAKEEIGVTIKPSALKLAHIMHRRSEVKGTTADERVDFYFVTASYVGEIKNMEPDKCDELLWCDLNHLPKNIIPCVKEALLNIAQTNILSERGWPA